MLHPVHFRYRKVIRHLLGKTYLSSGQASDQHALATLHLVS
jgi:hypothetical protein